MMSDGDTLVVLFHGYAQDETFFDDLLTHLPHEGFAYESLRAPRSHGAGSRSWFPLIDSPEFAMSDVVEVSEDVIGRLESLRASHSAVVLLGFSQGTEVATSIARHRPDLVDGLVLLSGVAVDRPDEYFRDDRARAKDFPVFVGKDPRDGVLPPSLVAFTDRWLSGFTRVTAKDYPGLGHRISAPEAEDVAGFLEQWVVDGPVGTAAATRPGTPAGPAGTAGTGSWTGS